MAAKITADSFLTVVRKSGLVEAERLRTLVEELASERVDVGSSAILATEFVDRGVITRWQADNLLKGKHRGYSLGKYRLLSLLGKGGMSSVYLAEHVLMRRRCAIKVLPAKRVAESSYLGRFHREAQAVAALDHPNIVRAYDVDQTEDGDRAIHFLVMEFVDGDDLQQIVEKEGPLDFTRALEFIRQSADGFAHAHEAGLVHRDVKPANLLVDKTGVVKILDLGLARFFDEGEDNSLTVANDEKVLGTADYLAPEQAIDSHSVDGRADVYSLGCTLYFLLTGHPPFTEGTLAQRLMAHQTKTPPALETERPETPPDLVAIVNRMMAKKPEERPQSMQEVSQLLDGWLEEHGGEEWHQRYERRPGSGVGMGSGNGSNVVRKAGSSVKTGTADTTPVAAPTEPSGDDALNSFLTGLGSQAVAEEETVVEAPAVVAAEERPATRPKPSKPTSSVAKRTSSPAPADPPVAVEDDAPVVIAEAPVVAVAESAPAFAVADVVPEPDVVEAEVVEAEVVEPESDAVRQLPGSRSGIDARILIGIGGGFLTVVLAFGLFYWFGGGSTEDPGGRGLDGTRIGDLGITELKVGPGETFETITQAIDYVAEYKSKDVGEDETWTIEVAGGREYAESLYFASEVFDGGRGFPANVLVKSSGDEPAILTGDGDGPIISIDGVERLVLEGFDIDATGKAVAVEVTGAVPDVAIRGGRIRGFTETGVSAEGVYVLSTESKAVSLTVEDVGFTGPASAVGVRVFSASALITSSHVVVRGSRFLGKLKTGVEVAGDAAGITIRDCIVSRATNGVALTGSGAVWSNLRIVNCSFFETKSAVRVQSLSPTSTGLVVSRNLFVDPKGPEFVVANGFSPQKFGRWVAKGGLANNWTSRPKPGKPAKTEADVFTGGGQRGAALKIVSKKPGDAGFLRPAKGAEHGKIAAKDGLKPYIGAVAP